MKHRLFLLFLLSFMWSASSFAQTDKDEKKEEQEEKKEINQDKVDFNLFRRQILGLKEYSEERRKVPALQKTHRGNIKIVAVVDSLVDSDDPKKLTGYIRQDIGENSVNVYEVIFDRSIKKIISVKPTGEANDEDKDEAATDKKPPVKKVIKKKKKDDDDEDDDDEKPVKKTLKTSKDDDD